MSSLLIDVPPELESRLREMAKERGVDVGVYVRALLEQQVMPEDVQNTHLVSVEERAARVDAIAGKYAHVPGSVDQFLQRKQEEIDGEEEQWERRHRGGE